jgi:hypothetical protein
VQITSREFESQEPKLSRSEFRSPRSTSTGPGAPELLEQVRWWPACRWPHWRWRRKEPATLVLRPREWRARFFRHLAGGGERNLRRLLSPNGYGRNRFKMLWCAHMYREMVDGGDCNVRLCTGTSATPLRAAMCMLHSDACVMSVCVVSVCVVSVCVVSASCVSLCVVVCRCVSLCVVVCCLCHCECACRHLALQLLAACQ